MNLEGSVPPYVASPFTISSDCVGWNDILSTALVITP